MRLRSDFQPASDGDCALRAAAGAGGTAVVGALLYMQPGSLASRREPRGSSEPGLAATRADAFALAAGVPPPLRAPGAARRARAPEEAAGSAAPAGPGPAARGGGALVLAGGGGAAALLAFGARRRGQRRERPRRRGRLHRQALQHEEAEREADRSRPPAEPDAQLSATRRGLALAALLAGGAAPAASEEGPAPGRFRWLPSDTDITPGGELDSIAEADAIAAEFSRIEREAFSLNFIIYLSRFLINFDQGAAGWWANSVLPLAPSGASATESAAFLRRKFANFAASVEFGLRRYAQGPSRRDDLLQRLVATYGQDQESCRHLALAFSMLQDQPQKLIAELLDKGDLSKRLTASFSPALTDYMAMDPKRLLPSTQYPVWDGGERRWVVPGLGSAMSSELPSRLQAFDAMNSIFGPRSSSLVSQERNLLPQDYLLFAFSGAAGCAFTHSVVIPLDVVKTRMQTNPGRYESMLGGVAQIQQQEGWGALLLGWEPTILGYLYYGITVYPGYEFFKRLFIELAGQEIVASFRVPLVLFAGACATVLACFGVCPAEAIRIRMVADQSVADKGLVGVAQIIMDDGGIGALYDGFSTILVRQVLFGMMKFLVFDYFGDFLFDIFPVLTEQVETQLLVSLISGATAGVVSSIVSQPADVVLSKLNQEGGRKSFLQAAGEIWEQFGPGGFFLGLGERCVWAGCIISGQFFLYDLCKALLGIKDLRVFLDVQI